MIHPNHSARSVVCEVCVDSVEGALAAEAGGADRLELCGPLALGGLTPTIGLLREVRRRCSLPIHAMLRPHARDFCYTALEMDVMLADLQLLLNEPIEGFVVGALTQDGTIDTPAMQQLFRWVEPQRLNFHRAFDEVSNFEESLQQLIDLGIPRVLTSGGLANAEVGCKNLQKWIALAKGRMVVMPGGGVTPQNVVEILHATGAREIHFSGREAVPFPVAVKFSPSPLPWQITSSERVAQIVQEVRKVYPAP